MDTSRGPDWMRRGLPTAVLFLAVFSTTWVLRQQQPGSAAPVAPPVERVMTPDPSVPMNKDVEDAFFQAPVEPQLAPEEPAPSPRELASDPDPDTQAEARMLLNLLDEEARGAD